MEKWEGKGEINERKNRKWKTRGNEKKNASEREPKGPKCKENHNDNGKMIG